MLEVSRGTQELKECNFARDCHDFSISWDISAGQQYPGLRAKNRYQIVIQGWFGYEVTAMMVLIHSLEVKVRCIQSSR